MHHSSDCTQSTENEELGVDEFTDKIVYQLSVAHTVSIQDLLNNTPPGDDVHTHSDR